MEKINNSDLINATRLLKRQKRQIEAVKQLRLSSACMNLVGIGHLNG